MTTSKDRLAGKDVNRMLHASKANCESKLTPRQREVLQLLAEGKKMPQVAKLLHITTRTVAFHKYRIMKEFDLRSSYDLVLFAIREHIVNPPDYDNPAPRSQME